MNNFYNFFWLSILVWSTVSCNTAIEQPIGRTSVLSTGIISSKQTTQITNNKYIIGQWRSEFDYYTFKDDFSYTYMFSPIGPNPPDVPAGLVVTGTWTLSPNGLVTTKQADRTQINIFKLQEENLMIFLGNKNKSIFRKLDANGKPLPVIEKKGIVALPTFDITQVIDISIKDNPVQGDTIVWDSEGLYSLTKDTLGFNGHVTFTFRGGFYQVKGINEQKRLVFSHTRIILLPQQASQEFLERLAHTPLITGTYDSAYMSSESDKGFEITLLFKDTSIVFYSGSQNEARIPWRVTLNNHEYVSYSDEVDEAIKIIEPFLALDLKDKLADQALDEFNFIFYLNK